MESTIVDQADGFDKVAQLEADLWEDGKAGGAKAGEEQGFAQGFAHGLPRGLILGQELGEYLGCVQAWLALLAATELKTDAKGEILVPLSVPRCDLLSCSLLA